MAKDLSNEIAQGMVTLLEDIVEYCYSVGKSHDLLKVAMMPIVQRIGDHMHATNDMVNFSLHLDDQNQLNIDDI